MTGWLLRYDGWDPAAEALREALCALGNGRFVTRAAAPECRAGGGHYPGTYAAGVFNRLADEVDGHRLENESIVNLPDWQSLTFRIEDGAWLDLSALTVSDYVQELDLRRGVLTRRFRIEDAAGRRTRVAQRRLVSMSDPCLAAHGVHPRRGELVRAAHRPLRAGRTGDQRRGGPVPRPRRPPPGAGPRPPSATALLTLAVETGQSRIRIGLAARHRVLVDGAVDPVAARARRRTPGSPRST